MRTPLALMFILAVLFGSPDGARADNALVAAVLPASRAVAVNVTATAFATVINTGPTAAQGCSIALPPGVPATFSYQQTDPNTNALVGSPNTPAAIDAGASQTFVFAITPTATFAQTNIALVFGCTSGQTAATINGVNTFLLTSSAAATPDVVALAATVSNDGIVRTPGTQAVAAFSVATINVGAAGAVTASVDTGGVALPATFAICQTDAQAQCQQPPAAEVSTNFGINQTGTFSIFVTSTGTVIPLDPAQFRSFVRFRLPSAASVGATSVAVQTQVTLGTGGGTLQMGPVGIQAPGQSAVSPIDFAVAPVAVPAAPPSGVTALNSAYAVSLTNADNAPDHGLNAAVSLTLPYGGLGVTDPNGLAVLHFDPATQTYEPTTIRSIDTNTQTVTVDSRQFSTFVLAILSPLLPDVVDDIGFVPLLHGFQTVNQGNAYLSPNGNCLGMSSFSIWFFRNRPDLLFNHYSSAGAPNSIADLVATRAHIMQGVYWNNYYQTHDYLPWQSANQGEVVKKMKAHLAFFRRPLVTIAGSSPGDYAHALVIYGYDANNFFVYDPNTPGTPQIVPYNAAGFGAYAGFTSWTAIGFPSFGGPENFAQIAAEGDGGFSSSSNITITNPTAGANVNGRQTQLAGSLGGGLNGLSTAAVLLNGLSPFQNVPVGGGFFNKTIDVASGPNTLVFIAGVQAYSGQLSTTLANSAILIRKFNGPPAALFRSTARWNQNNIDVDQYVTEPGASGDTSWYFHHTTAAGLTLDFDNTSGFGPENTTLEATATPIPGVYKVRLHYYSDHSTHQTASGSVTITLRERQPTQQVATRLWVIGVSNPGNDSPGATGSDWVDIANVDVVNNTITFP